MSDRNRSDRDYRFVPPKPGAEVDDELRFHLEQRIQDYIANGMSPDDARRTALERFGNVQGVRDECTRLLAEDRKADARRDLFDDLRQDLRFAFRSAMRAPLFSLLAVVTLALGIGANAAVFGVVKSVLLDALPYADAGRLMRLWCPIPGAGVSRASFSAGTISDVRERQRSFTSLGAFLGPRDVLYANGNNTEVVQGMWIEPALLRTLGVSPARGAGFRDEDGLHDTATVVLLSNGAWQRLF